MTYLPDEASQQQAMLIQDELYAAEPPAWMRLYMDKDMHMALTLNDLLDSKFLKKEDLGDDEHVVTIRKVTKTNTARDDQEPKYKAAIKFDEFPKPMVANKTNLKRIAAMLGDDLGLWEGKQVTIFYDPDVEFGGEVVGGIRVKVERRSKVKPRKPMSDDDINAALDDGRDTSDIPF